MPPKNNTTKLLSDVVALAKRQVGDLDAVMARLARARTALAEVVATAQDPSSKKRGRKGMGPEERHDVSERMKAYWRRKLGKDEPEDQQ